VPFCCCLPARMAAVEAVPSMEESSIKFAEYLQSYTAASFALLGRWPTFVPEDERYADTLEPGNLRPCFSIGPEVPEELKVQGSNVARGAALNAARPGSGAASATSNAAHEKLRETVDRLSSKLRHEVAARTRANDESMRRGMQLQSVQRESAAMQETVRRQAQQLEHAREVTLKLEEELREANVLVETADVRLVKERKTRYVWEQRTAKLQKKVAPLQKEVAMLSGAVGETQKFLAEAMERGAEDHRKVKELSLANERMQKGASAAVKQSNVSREERAHAGMQLTLMADRRDELLEDMKKLETEAAERTEALATMEAAKDDAMRLAQEERRLHLSAEATVHGAEVAQAAAEQEARRWRSKAEELERELERQREHVSALVTQDGIREAEQRKLFDGVTELLARIQYLGELPADELGMHQSEKRQHRDEALRHLKALREAHALSTFPTQIVAHPATMATGTAMLKAAMSVAPPASKGASEMVDGLCGSRSPRHSSAAGSPRSHHADRKAASQSAATPLSKSAAPKPRLASASLDASTGRGRSSPREAAGHAPSEDASGFTSWRSQVQPGLSEPPALWGGAHGGAGRAGGGGGGSSRPSPRVRAEDPARASVAASEPAAEWEKQKLLSMIQACN